MPPQTRWHPLAQFRDASVPKLNNLRLAPAGIPVPPTYWARAEELSVHGMQPLPNLAGLSLPCIIRSGSPTEDTGETSNAGQFLSLSVDRAEEFPAALAQVVAALPKRGGRREGVVFLQPKIDAEVAGVTFFDGFYYEESSAIGSNDTLTSGRGRGEVRRGHQMRGDARSDFLAAIHGVFGGHLDIEWAVPASGPWRGRRVLLQVRPALFPIRRCETLSLANHKEIIGDLPSPWMTGVLADMGHPVMSYFAAIEPAMKRWDEPYAIEMAERPWMNFSAFFRLMDHWGLPRTMVTEGVGGEAAGPEDGKILWPRFLRKLPTLALMAIANFRTWGAIRAGLKAIHADLDEARTLLDLQRANVRAMDFSVRTNFAIIGVLAVLTKIRRALGFTQAARVVTHAMMAEYAEIASRPHLEDRLSGLEDWLQAYGHRGPLESDPCQRRFREMRDDLVASLSSGPAPAPRDQPQPSQFWAALGRPLFLADELRERYRERLMRWWARLRRRILEQARIAVREGHLAAVDDVFYLRAEDLAAAPETWRARVSARKVKLARARAVDLPTTVTRDELEALIDETAEREQVSDVGFFRGIGLGTSPVVGTVVLGDSVAALLNGGPLPETPVLVAETLEPSWAVLFPRFAAVVAELGGELSHAAILLREAGIPSVVNAAGIFRGVADGDTVRVDPSRGTVEVINRNGEAEEQPGSFSLIERSS